MLFPIHLSEPSLNFLSDLIFPIELKLQDFQVFLKVVHKYHYMINLTILIEDSLKDFRLFIVNFKKD